MMDRNQQAFIEEARDLLSGLEDSLLEIEHDPLNSELVGKIFRAMHTIKGASSMFGFDAIASFTHDIETAFDAVREGVVAVTPQLVSMTLASRDHISALLSSAESEVEPDLELTSAGDELLKRFRELVPQTPPGKTDTGSPHDVKQMMPETNQRAALYRIHFKPPENILLRGLDPMNLIQELAAMGEERHVVHSEETSPDESRADLCHSVYDVLLSTSHPLESLQDVFIFVEEDSELRIEKLADASACDKDVWQRLIEAMQASKGVPTSVLISMIKEAHQIHQRVRNESSTYGGAGGQHPDLKSAQSIKVPSERLDKLVNLVGELVTVQARLTQAAVNLSDPSLTQIAEEVEALISELRDNAMSIRMVPIGTTFGRFKRLVRDLSAELGKEIQLVTEGEDTELDKTVIERLGDPLVHMIRNSIDHGIELPAQREQVGKARAGTIRLSASHSGTSVKISISDDGAGFDTEAIRLKAVMQGMIDPDATPTEQELLSIVFAPGFSTAKEVTSVSGRGVGMDVVHRSIEELGGQIEVSNSPGKGATITLKLPLTLAIIEGLLVKVGSELFVLPLASIKECVELPALEQRRGKGGQLINVRGEIIPYVRLRDFFGITGETSTYEYVVITEIDGRRCGFAVDAVLGEHQIVIKSLGLMYKDVEGISGATVLGDGTVALIIDIPPLIAVAVRERERLVRFETIAGDDSRNKRN